MAARATIQSSILDCPPALPWEGFFPLCYLHLFLLRHSASSCFARSRAAHLRFARCASPRVMRRSLVRPPFFLTEVWVGSRADMGTLAHGCISDRSVRVTKRHRALLPSPLHATLRRPSAALVHATRSRWALACRPRQGGGGSHHGQSTPLLRILHALRRPPVPTLSWRAGCCLFILPTFILCLQQAPLPIRLSAH